MGGVVLGQGQDWDAAHNLKLDFLRFFHNCEVKLGVILLVKQLQSADQDNGIFSFFLQFSPDFCLKFAENNIQLVGKI